MDSLTDLMDGDMLGVQEVVIPSPSVEELRHRRNQAMRSLFLSLHPVVIPELLASILSTYDDRPPQEP